MELKKKTENQVMKKVLQWIASRKTQNLKLERDELLKEATNKKILYLFIFVKVSMQICVFRKLGI